MLLVVFFISTFDIVVIILSLKCDFDGLRVRNVYKLF